MTFKSCLGVFLYFHLSSHLSAEFNPKTRLFLQINLLKQTKSSKCSQRRSCFQETHCFEPHLLIQEPFMFLFEAIFSSKKTKMTRLFPRYENKYLVGNSVTLCFFFYWAVESAGRAAGRCEICHDGLSHLSRSGLMDFPPLPHWSFEATCDFSSRGSSQFQGWFPVIVHRYITPY